MIATVLRDRSTEHARKSARIGLPSALGAIENLNADLSVDASVPQVDLLHFGENVFVGQSVRLPHQFPHCLIGQRHFVDLLSKLLQFVILSLNLVLGLFNFRVRLVNLMVLVVVDEYVHRCGGLISVHQSLMQFGQQLQCVRKSVAQYQGSAGESDSKSKMAYTIPATTE